MREKNKRVPASVATFGATVNDELTRRLAHAVEGHIGARSRKSAGPIQLIQEIALESSSKDKKFFTDVEEVCLDTINFGEQESCRLAAEVLLGSVAQHYESTGLFKKAFEVESKVMAWAIEANDLMIQRRSHNCMGVRYIRFCDFGKACHHIDRACKLANKIGNPFYVFASLGNAVALMKSMGLLNAARRLALEIIKQPYTDEYYNHVHFINANNGMAICHSLGDLKNASIFYEIAKKTVDCCGSLISELNIAYFESATIVHLAANGNSLRAFEIAEAALCKNRVLNNIRINALLSCAQAEARLILRDRHGISQSCEALERLLVPCREISTHYEDVLRLLVRLHRTKRVRNRAVGNVKTIYYLRCLREYLITVKHRAFFAEEFTKFNSAVAESLKLVSPSYRIPNWVIESCDSATLSAEKVGGRHVDQDYEIDVLPCSLAKLSGGELETRLRCNEFDIAENWCVAAEIALGLDGRHCFRVGRLAAVLAFKIGFSREQAVRLDLACRLHDIGKIVTILSSGEFRDTRARGKFSPFCQHTSAGRELLSLSSNSTLKLGSLIAQHHHEWWNGDGFPSGLKGDAIPIEARLCAVADTFLTLIRPVVGTIPFDLVQAQRQVIAMAGMQLDPHIVKLLVEIIEKTDQPSGYEESLAYTRSSLGKSNKEVNYLEGVLELIA